MLGEFEMNKKTIHGTKYGMKVTKTGRVLEPVITSVCNHRNGTKLESSMQINKVTCTVCLVKMAKAGNTLALKRAKKLCNPDYLKLFGLDKEELNLAAKEGLV